VEPLIFARFEAMLQILGHNKRMQITKYEHACLAVEHRGKVLVIDPGCYSSDLTKLQNVVGIVITHVHDDHCSEPQLETLLRNNPEAQIFGTGEVKTRLNTLKTNLVQHGDFYTVGGFTLEFFGDLHAQIHHSIPLVQNCAVLINSELYYPGDSYTTPDRPVKVLACPTSAPWLKISEVMDFLAEVKPAMCFPTHNIHLSEVGHQMNNSRVQQVVESHGGSFSYLLPGQTLEV
jgi:L-ascorbate metabolism protein UlaG (beta-lactamase superfamily)